MNSRLVLPERCADSVSARYRSGLDELRENPDEFKRAAALLEKYKDRILNLSGVHGFGIGMQNEKVCFRLYCTGADPSYPQEIEGIPVLVCITGMIQPA